MLHHPAITYLGQDRTDVFLRLGQLDVCGKESNYAKLDIKPDLKCYAELYGGQLHTVFTGNSGYQMNR